jgi:hypothetical protein
MIRETGDTVWLRIPVQVFICIDHQTTMSCISRDEKEGVEVHQKSNSSFLDLFCKSTGKSKVTLANHKSFEEPSLSESEQFEAAVLQSAVPSLSTSSVRHSMFCFAFMRQMSLMIFS